MFSSARLKLTFWYLAIIMFVSVAFSFVIYKVLSTQVEHFANIQQLQLERRLRDSQYTSSVFCYQLPPLSQQYVDTLLIDEAKRNIAFILLVVNATILVLSGILGYVLAGRTLRPIKEMMEEQNRFISDSSHELRTPLTSLKSTMEVYLRDKNLTLGEAKTLISESIEEVDKLKELSDGLLQLAQYQIPNGHSHFETASLKQLIHKTVSKVKPLAKPKKITIDSKVTDIQFEANPNSLVEVLTILLDNAIKYSPVGSKITIQAKRRGGTLHISVSDQGFGISPKDISHVFDRFYRADEARYKTSAGGYGLGLSIAKKIVDIHHGTITVTSQVGIGTTFTLNLPVAQGNYLTKHRFFS